MVALRYDMFVVTNLLKRFPVLDLMPYNFVDKYKHFGGTFCLYLQGRNCLHVFVLKMETAGSSETVTIYHITYEFICMKNARNKKALRCGKM
jgi:hypothetical protein